MNFENSPLLILTLNPYPKPHDVNVTRQEAGVSLSLIDVSTVLIKSFRNNIRVAKKLAGTAFGPYCSVLRSLQGNLSDLGSVVKLVDDSPLGCSCDGGECDRL